MKEFKKINGEVVTNVVDYVNDFIEAKRKMDYTVEIHIGCDCQRHGRTYLYATAICLRMIKPTGVGGGVHIIPRTDSFPTKVIGGDEAKLMKEAEIAIQTALELREAGFNNDLISVHIDFNPDNRFISNKVLNQGRGWIEGLDFKCERKPYAWAASYSGDRAAKNKFHHN